MDGIMFFAALLLLALVIIGCAKWATAYLDGRNDARAGSYEHLGYYMGLSRKLYVFGLDREHKRTDVEEYRSGR